MKTGQVDILAFIGTSKAAKILQHAHPNPNRLRLALGLDAKNPAFILKDADLDVAVSECLLGSLSFNGQRCTALKVLFVQQDIAEEFVQRFSKAVDSLILGLPWGKGVKITPLPEPEKPALLREMIADAISKGAKVVNARGNQFDRTFVFPSVLYPVNSTMRAYSEEQFGPLVPIVPFKEIEECYQYILETSYGQQASVFTRDLQQLPGLIDLLTHNVARVNVNCQCQRGPDTFPFTGRKDSATGTLSVFDALRTMSIRCIVSTKDTDPNIELLSDLIASRKSSFVRADLLI